MLIHCRLGFTVDSQLAGFMKPFLSNLQMAFYATNPSFIVFLIEDNKLNFVDIVHANGYIYFPINLETKQNLILDGINVVGVTGITTNSSYIRSYNFKNIFRAEIEYTQNNVSNV